MEKVKFAALALCIVSSGAEAQSPYLSVSAGMDTRGNTGKKYRMEMKICKPLKMSAGDWFTPDTSAIDFSRLDSANVECGEYMDNGDGIEVLAGNISFPKYNSYSFSNQVFAWERIIVFRITDETQGETGNLPRMYLVLPVKYKSFVTHIYLPNIPFTEGKVLDAGNALGAYAGGKLSIRFNTGDLTTTPVENFYAKTWLE
jgi:hypothetical protein